MSEHLKGPGHISCPDGWVRILAGVVILFALGFTALAQESRIASLRSASEVDYPPFSIVDADGRADGFSVELLRAALARMDRDVTFRTGAWGEVKGWLERGEVDCLPLVGRTPEREAVFDFTVPYMTMHGAIVVRHDTEDVHTLADLRGRRVGVMGGDNAEEFLRREERGIEIVTTTTFTDAFHALAAGRCDAVVVQRLVAVRLLDEMGLSGRLRIVERPVSDFSQAFCFAVRKGDSKTLSLLNEGLALVVADGTHRRLHAKWFAHLELPTDRPIVIGGDHNYPPFEFLDTNGRPAGYNVDLVRAVANAAGLDILVRLGSWSEMVRSLEKGDIDAIQGMLYSVERDAVFDFSPAHIVNHHVAVVRRESGPSPTSVTDLVGKRLVLQRGDIMEAFCREHGLTDQLTLVDTQEEALRDVVEGRQDCALVARLTAFYWIEHEGWDNLVVGQAPLLSPEYCFAVPQGHQALLAQLSEGLAAVRASGEYRRIQEKWLGVYKEPLFGWHDVVKHVVLIAGPLLLLVLLALLWSWVLRRQVARRTAELRKSEERFRIAQEMSPDGFSILHPVRTENGEVIDFTWVYENQTIAGINGTDLQNVLGKRLLEVFPTHRDTTAFETYLQVANTGTSRVLEEVCVEGTLARPTWLRLVVVSMGEDLAVHCQNITARKQTEQELRDSEARFKALHNASFGGIAIHDKGVILECNQGLSEITGYTYAELIGMNGLLLISDATRGKVLRNIETGYEKPYEAEGVRKDGATYPLRLEGRNIRYRGKEVRVVEFRDIHELREAEREKESLEAQLRQAQKMESVGRLAGGIAHDFNNLLMGILGYAELCRDAIDADHPIQEWLTEIKYEAERSASLTRQLLAFARKQTIAPKVLDLNDAVGNMLKMLQRLIGEDIDLVWKPGAGLWPLKLDPSQVDQILANLCVNARDAIGGAGKVTIETGNATIDAAYCEECAEASPGDYVLLAVSDDGCGMDHETMKTIFEPFFTTKGVGEGTGLGLATVYGIVKQNKGFVNVYSEPGKGATFRIYLPRVAEEVAGQESRSDADSGLGGTETILLVEDEKSIRLILDLCLKGLGYTVLVAESPEGALRLVAEHGDGIDLLLTDVVMPGMSGRDLAGKLAPDYPAMKVLYMSGYTADVIAHRGILNEGVHFLSKPVSRSELARKVRCILDGTPTPRD